MVRSSEQLYTFAVRTPTPTALPRPSKVQSPARRFGTRGEVDWCSMFKPPATGFRPPPILGYNAAKIGSKPRHSQYRFSTAALLTELQRDQMRQSHSKAGQTKPQGPRIADSTGLLDVGIYVEMNCLKLRPW